MATTPKRRITFAYFMQGNAAADRDELRAFAKKILPEEYEMEMAGFLYCPGCFTHIERTPMHKDIFKNGRDPFYRHLSKYKDVACYLRAKKPEGKLYRNEEEAKRAIENMELSVISGFLQERPLLGSGLDNDEYHETPVEDVDGPTTEVPIGRHVGEVFKLPSKISTVAGICRGFDKNLGKYFFLPKSQQAVRLAELLQNVADVPLDILDTPRQDRMPGLYFGRIMRSFSQGKPHSTRMTRLAHNSSVADFTLKAPNWMCEGKGITDNSVGRIVICYGVVTQNGIGLALDRLAWGEFALLPDKYNDLILPGENI